ncbi:MAG: Gfo/Idh/MocA family oxidoreductase [Bryobacteraceae bacterium]|nr:Gfo/Idh/MocA family oxidoreductase [Bryobacteraceae bacterium]
MNLTRRGLAALAAPAFLSASGGKIRAAVVGTGHGHAVSKIKALRSMPEYELVGVCRPFPEEPAAPDVLAGVRSLSLREILDDASIEMVAIETAEVDRNLEYAEQFVHAGRFVHLDKPPGASLERLRKLLAHAADRKRSVQMGYQWRYQPAMQAAVEASRQGWLGRIYRFRATIDKLILADERRHLAKFRGGMMFSEGCHLIDRAVAVLGKPRKVTGFLRHDSTTMPDGLADNTLVVFEYESAMAEISLSGFHPHGTPHRYLEIAGTNGSARVQPYSLPSTLTIDLATAAGPYKSGLQTLEHPAPPGLPYTPEFREFAATIRAGQRPSHSPEHDLVTHETLLRVCGMLEA